MNALLLLLLSIFLFSSQVRKHFEINRIYSSDIRNILQGLSLLENPNDSKWFAMRYFFSHILFRVLLITTFRQYKKSFKGSRSSPQKYRTLLFTSFITATAKAINNVTLHLRADTKYITIVKKIFFKRISKEYFALFRIMIKGSLPFIQSITTTLPDAMLLVAYKKRYDKNIFYKKVKRLWSNSVQREYVIASARLLSLRITTIPFFPGHHWLRYLGNHYPRFLGINV